MSLNGQIDAACDQFEADWRSGQAPRMEEYLAGAAEELRPALLRELLLVEIECRRQQGEHPTIAEYVARFPQAGDVIAAAFCQPSADRGSVTFQIVAGAHQGERRVCNAHETFVVGRGVDATWQITKDPYFSRYQFRIETHPPECRLIDLESLNGTLVNGSRVREVDLKNGDHIQCGETVFEVSIVDQRTQQADQTLELPPSRPAPGSARGPTSSAPGRIADFDIQRELGRGAMGVVYHARQRATGRDVAVKLIEPEVAARPEAVQLFLREAHILSQLRHPRIVDYVSLGLHDGQMYIAMEYLPAINVRKLLDSQSRPRQLRLACGLACYMLEALQHAHEKDIVHRDVKPTNVLVYKVDKKVQLKLADFGLAKNYLNAGFSSVSRENEVRGTLAYMAPEQLINCRYAKPACDIYAVGACLYWFLSGTLPIDVQAGVNRVARLLNATPVPLAERCRDVPLDLAAQVDRALARDPGDRFSSAEHMRKNLLRFLE